MATPGRHGLKGISPGIYATPIGRYRVEFDTSAGSDLECGCIHCQDGRMMDCPNDGIRIDKGWIVWDLQHPAGEDYARGTGPLEFDTMKLAAAYALGLELEDKS